MNKFAAAVAALSLVVPAGFVVAGPLAKDQVTLRHADLDLATADGQRRLTSRLREAAIAV